MKVKGSLEHKKKEYYPILLRLKEVMSLNCPKSHSLFMDMEPEI